MKNGTLARVLCLLVVAGFATTVSCAVTPAGESPAASPLAFAPAQARHSAVDFNISCQECHATQSPAVVAAWESSKHAPNIGCFVCHGDGEVEFAARPAADHCLSCHSTKKLTPRMESMGCHACHDAHRLTTHR
jgi:hypothetical protein